MPFGPNVTALAWTSPPVVEPVCWVHCSWPWASNTLTNPSEPLEAVLADVVDEVVGSRLLVVEPVTAI